MTYDWTLGLLGFHGRRRAEALSAVAPGWCAFPVAYASHSALVSPLGRFCGTGGSAWYLRRAGGVARTGGTWFLGPGTVCWVSEREPQNLLLDLVGFLLLLEGFILLEGKRGSVLAEFAEFPGLEGARAACFSNSRVIH